MNFRHKIQGTALDCFAHPVDLGLLKVTVRFETEGNGQNEIVSHMDRSEIKL